MGLDISFHKPSKLANLYARIYFKMILKNRNRQEFIVKKNIMLPFQIKSQEKYAIQERICKYYHPVMYY